MSNLVHQVVSGSDIRLERIIEVGMKSGQALIDLIELASQSLGFYQQRLTLLGGSRTICDTLKAGEEVGETLRDSRLATDACGRRCAFGPGGFAINLLAEVGLGVLQGGLPRFKEGSHADLSLQLPVH